MKAAMRYLVLFLLSGALLICMAKALADADRLDISSTAWLFDLTDTPLNPQKAAGMLAQEQSEAHPMPFLLWSQLLEKQIRNPVLNRSAAAGCLIVYGDSSLLFGQTVLDPSDHKGCLISKDLAYRLFGSVNADGMEIELDGRTLMVRGVLDQYDGIIAAAPLPSDQAEFHMLTLGRPDNSQSTDKDAQSFMDRHGIYGTSRRISLYHTAARLAALLMPLLAAAWGCGKLFKEAFRLRHLPAPAAGCFLAAAAALAVFLWFMPYPPRFPASLIPGSWSDFTFWQNKFSDTAEQIRLLVQTEKTVPEQAMLAVSWNAAVNGVLAALLLPLWIKTASAILRDNLFYLLCGCMVLSFLVAVWLQNDYRIMWLLLPWALLCQALSSCLKQIELTVLDCKGK